jgi:hypothetical protein
MNKPAATRELALVAPSLPLNESLAMLISEVKAQIQLCLGLKGKPQRVAAIKIEKQLRVIGDAVEARAMYLKGWDSVGDFRILVENELASRRATFTDDRIRRYEEMIKETREYIEEMDTKYPIAYPHRLWPSNRTEQYEIAVSLNRDCIEDIARIRKNLRAKDLGMSDLLFQLRQAYIVALSELRPFGGELLVEDWFKFMKVKRTKDSIPYIKGEQSAIAKVRETVKLLPSDWIVASNASSRPLFIAAWRYSTEYIKGNSHLPEASYNQGVMYREEIRIGKVKASSIGATMSEKDHWEVAYIEFPEKVQRQRILSSMN